MSNRLYPEDQARVEAVIKRGTYAPERKPFRVWLLLSVIIAFLGAITLVSYGIAWHYDML